MEAGRTNTSVKCFTITNIKLMTIDFAIDVLIYHLLSFFDCTKIDIRKCQITTSFRKSQPALAKRIAIARTIPDPAPVNA